MVVTTLLMLLLLALDRFTKTILAAWLEGKGMVKIIPGVIGFELMEGGNTGAAFGILENSTILLIIVTSVAVIGMLYLLYIKKLYSPVLRAALLLITAGGIGNLYDRIVYGRVTDFIEFLFMRFAVFNIADCYVTIGAVIAIAYLIFSKKDAPLFLSDAKQPLIGKDEKSGSDKEPPAHQNDKENK